MDPVDEIALYVMVKAMPEHGGRLKHSLFPEASAVLTSTTPGPLAVPGVHVPVTVAPSIQIAVPLGVTMRGPTAALVGFRTAGSVCT